MNWVAIAEKFGIPAVFGAFMCALVIKILGQWGGQIDRFMSVNQKLVEANMAQDARLAEMEASLARIERGQSGNREAAAPVAVIDASEERTQPALPAPKKKPKNKGGRS